MTIAAGLLYKDGVILCADTEISHSTAVTYEPKIEDFFCQIGKFAFAYAGNQRASVSAIQKCMRRLSKLAPSDDWFTEIERIIDRHYRKTVFSDPSHSYDHGMHWWLLITVRVHATQQVHLFVTDRTAIAEVFTYDCIGIGRDLAHYLIRPSHDTGMSESNALFLASFVLANVKHNVSGCGGISQFVALRRDGATSRFSSVVDAGHEPITSVEWIEAHSARFGGMARNLLFSLVDRNASDSEFDKVLTLFREHVEEMRRNWRDKTVHESFHPLVFKQ